MQERLAVVETKVTHIEATLVEVRGDVKGLISKVDLLLSAVQGLPTKNWVWGVWTFWFVVVAGTIALISDHAALAHRLIDLISA